MKLIQGTYARQWHLDTHIITNCTKTGSKVRMLISGPLVQSQLFHELVQKTCTTLVNWYSGELALLACPTEAVRDIVCVVSLACASEAFMMIFGTVLMCYWSVIRED